MAIERVRLGIPILDAILGGGIPRGSIILLAGHPGSGKSTLATQFALEGARNREPTIYLSFAESKSKFFKYMVELGLDVSDAEKKGLFHFIEAPTVADAELANIILEHFASKLFEVNAKRAVIDSLTALIQAMGVDRTRAAVHNLVRLFETAGVTAIIIEDLPYGVEIVGHGIEEFLVDGVIVLKISKQAGLPRRTLEFRKMRGTKIKYYEIPFSIKQGVGIVPLFYERPTTDELRASSKHQVVSTGLYDLDNALGGGIPVGSQTVIVGPPGAGKSILSSVIALAWAKRGRRVLYITLNESPNQVVYRLNALKNSNLLNKEEVAVEILGDQIEYRSKAIYVMGINLTNHTLDEFYMNALNLVKKVKPDLLVIDGYSNVLIQANSNSVVHLGTNFALHMKYLGVTGINTLTLNYPEGGLETMTMMGMTDIVIGLDIKRDNRRLTREITIWKNIIAPVPEKSGIYIISKGPRVSVKWETGTL